MKREARSLGAQYAARLLASPFIPLNCVGYTHYAPGVKLSDPPPSSPLHTFLSTHRVLRRILGCRVYWLRYTHIVCEFRMVPTSPLASGRRSHALNSRNLSMIRSNALVSRMQLSHHPTVNYQLVQHMRPFSWHVHVTPFRPSGNNTPMYAQQALLLPCNQTQLHPYLLCIVVRSTIGYPICFKPT